MIGKLRSLTETNRENTPSPCVSFDRRPKPLPLLVEVLTIPRETNPRRYALSRFRFPEKFCGNRRGLTIQFGGYRKINVQLSKSQVTHKKDIENNPSSSSEPFLPQRRIVYHRNSLGCKGVSEFFFNLFRIGIFRHTHVRRTASLHPC